MSKILLTNDARIPGLQEIRSKLQRGTPVPLTQREDWRTCLNIDSVLASSLTELGHEVRLFDGYEDDLVTPILNRLQGAGRLSALIMEYQPDAILMDLAFHGQFGYGPWLLEWLYANHGNVMRQIRVVIGSKHVISHAPMGQGVKISVDGIAYSFPHVFAVVNRDSTDILTVGTYLT